VFDAHVVSSGPESVLVRFKVPEEVAFDSELLVVVSADHEAHSQTDLLRVKRSYAEYSLSPERKSHL